MDIDDLKPFDPTEVDETLTRVVVHGGSTYLLFPYVNATGPEPEYNSVGMVIAGSAATVQDFNELTALLQKTGQGALWRIVFNTPWLIPIPEEGSAPQRAERKSGL
jgi:hypothetical protein